MTTCILGGGLAGVSLAYHLNEKTLILEKEQRAGGLMRSYDINGVTYDIGPHILFSKNKETLKKLTSFTKSHQLKRSNRIFHKGILVKYPFENDLYALDQETREYCFKEFLNNPYKKFKNPQNMLQFFLTTFGEGITRTYLQPYNEKIWKFDPCYMDTQMVDRIPTPPKEDVIKSAHGKTTEGYTHQLYFSYPDSNGIETVIKGILAAKRLSIEHGVSIKRIIKKKTGWEIITNSNSYECDRLINCMPVHELLKVLEIKGIEALKKIASRLNYNSIHICMLQVKRDNIGNNFALYFADKNTIFHRLSKLNYLGPNYKIGNNGATLMAEITFRPESYLATISPQNIKASVINNLCSHGLINKTDVIDYKMKSFKYAYVIYDLDHRKNIDTILRALQNSNIESCGRFAEFEYLNMDGVIDHSVQLANKYNRPQKGEE